MYPYTSIRVARKLTRKTKASQFKSPKFRICTIGIKPMIYLHPPESLYRKQRFILVRAGSKIGTEILYRYEKYHAIFAAYITGKV
jgi:hypothetical protein